MISVSLTLKIIIIAVLSGIFFTYGSDWLGYFKLRAAFDRILLNTEFCRSRVILYDDPCMVNLSGNQISLTFDGKTTQEKLDDSYTYSANRAIHFDDLDSASGATLSVSHSSRRFFLIVNSVGRIRTDFEEIQ